MKRKLEKSLQAKRESKHIDFKETFDPASKADWCEILKDIVAMANSEGGVILIGLNNNGNPTGSDVSDILQLDSACIPDKIYSYTEIHFSDVEILELHKGGYQLAAIDIGSAKVPMVFAKPGTYAISTKEQKTAFSRGTIYFRHGAKSEPGNTGDLTNVMEYRLREIRKEWMAGVRKVVQAPVGSSVNILPPDVHETDSPQATPIRIVDDPTAPRYHIVDPNKTHPHRQMDVVKKLNGRLKGRDPIKSYDVFAVRRMQGTDKQIKFYYKPTFGSPQYSPAFVEWLETCYYKDPDFFKKARNFMSKQQRKII